MAAAPRVAHAPDTVPFAQVPTTVQVEREGLDCMSSGVALAWATEALQKGDVTQGETLCFGAVARPQRVLKGSGELILVKLQRLVDTT